ncbi:carbohydrate-binding module family 14 protein [Streptomyces sp. NPDC004244]
MRKLGMAAAVAGLVLAGVAAPQALAVDPEPQYITKPCPGEQQYYPDEDPGRFWECSNGVAYRFDCPASLHWDVKLLTCNDPKLAGVVAPDPTQG